MNKELTFLKESNAIEGVFDPDSLKQATIAWEFLKGQDKLTASVILRVHKTLMLHQKLYPDEKGYYRKIKVYVGGREGLNVLKIPEAMENLIMNMNDLVDNGKNESQRFLEGMIKAHHVRYEKIHPFVDGNGRTGRMFMNWERLRLGLPLLTIYDKDKQEYYKWFK